MNELWEIFWRTLQVSGSAVTMAVAVGLPLGVWLGLSPRLRIWPIRGLVHTGMAAPPVVVGLLLYILLSHAGPLAFLGWLFTPQAMILAQFLLALPFVVGITMSAVSAVPAEIPLQVKSLGASDWQCRWAVLHEARDGILLAIAAALGRSLSEVGAVLIVGGNIRHHTRVLTTAIVLETSKGDFRFALALGAVLLTMALVLNIVILRLQGERVVT